MLELYQFKHSTFCLKVRMVLQAKKMSYRTVEIVPGIGQVNVFRLSGQRKVPVLKDGENVIADSSAIIKYLENITKEPRLLPDESQASTNVHIIEDWADTTLAKYVRMELIKAAAIDPSLREALLPEDFPDSLKGLINNLPCELINGLTQALNNEKSNILLHSLEKISNLVRNNQWLVGNSLSIADIAVASQLSLLCFPTSAGKDLVGKGCPGYKDNPLLEPLFKWRDNLEQLLLDKDPASI